MNRKSSWVGFVGVACSLVSFFGGLRAQEELTPPKPLFESKIPAGQQCTTTMARPALEKALAAGRKFQIAPYKTKRVFAVLKPGSQLTLETKSSDGLTMRKYLRDGILLASNSNAGIAGAPIHSEEMDEFRDAFPELYWVKSNLFTGEVKVDGVKYLAYVEPAEKARLLINPETLLPVRYERPAVQFYYMYGPISAEFLQLPPDLAALYAELMKGKQK